MSYPGNPSLSESVRTRILSTYEQTLALAAKGSTQEALLGCDFILRMDPDFASAQVLQERLRAAAGPVEVEDLRPGAEPRARDDGVSLGEGVIDLGDLDVLDTEMPDLEDWQGPGEPEAAIAPDALEAALQDLLDSRQLQRLVQVADQHKREVASNPAVRKLVTTAYTRLEAEPYVLDFLASAREAIHAGNAEDARTLLEKGRSLDPSHPGIEELGQLRESFGPAPGRVASPPTVRPPTEESFGALLIPKAEDQPPAISPSSAPSAPSAFDLPPLPSGEPMVAEPLSGFPGANSIDEVAFGAPLAVASAAPELGADDRITQLLVEGQNAFDAGSYQAAIDSWSRIFLIDIDHEEAARRIDLARQHKAEDERRVEEIFSEAIKAYDAGDAEASKEGFQQVLQLNPSHMAAAEYLEQIERDPLEAPTVVPLHAGPPPTAGAGMEGHDLAPMPGAVMVPPDGSEPAQPATPVGGTQAGVSSGSGALRKFVMLGAPVLLLLAAAGWYGWQHRADFFPNSTAEEEANAEGGNPILRATQLYNGGKPALAIKVLRGVSLVDPRHDEAQALIESWQADLAEVVVESNDEQVAEAQREQIKQERQERLLAAARRAFEEGRNLDAVESFEQAQRLAPLPAEDQQQLVQANRLLEPLQQQLEYVRQGEWAAALPVLWRLHGDDPSNRDVVSLMVDSYYNLAIRDLQRGDAAVAAEKLKEARDLMPNDEALRRHYLFARSYAERQKDLQYWIYTKYLPSR